MALYEHLLIARQDISAQQVDALATHLKTIVEGEGGKIEKQEYWGLRGLAYRIKKNRKGHYVLLNINAPAAAVIELERQLKINEDVLRYITVKVDQFDVSSNKNRRDDRADKPEGSVDYVMVNRGTFLNHAAQLSKRSRQVMLLTRAIYERVTHLKKSAHGPSLQKRHPRSRGDLRSHPVRPDNR